MKKYGKKINRILNTIIGCCIGVFIGHGAYVFLNAKKYPASQSAPWVTSIIIYGVITAVVIAAALIVKVIIRSKESKP